MILNKDKNIVYKKFVEEYGEDSHETKLYKYILNTFPQNALITEEEGEVTYNDDVLIILSSLAVLFGSNKRVIQDLEEAYDLGKLVTDDANKDNLLLLLADALNFEYTSETTKENIIEELKDKRIFLKYYQQIIRNKGTIRALETILNLFTKYTENSNFSYEIKESFEKKQVYINLVGSLEEFVGVNTIIRDNFEGEPAPQINQNHFLYKIISDVKPAGLTYNILLKIIVHLLVGEDLVIANPGTDLDYFEEISITFTTDINKGNFSGKNTIESRQRGQSVSFTEVIPDEDFYWWFDGWDKPFNMPTTVDVNYEAQWRKRKKLDLTIKVEDSSSSSTIYSNRADEVNLEEANFPANPTKPSTGGTHYTFERWVVVTSVGVQSYSQGDSISPTAVITLTEEDSLLEVKAEFSSETYNLLAPEIVSAELVSHNVRQDNLLEQITIKNNNQVQVDFEVRISPGGHLVEQGYLEGNAEVTLHNLFSEAGNIGKERPVYSLDIRFKASWYNDSDTVRVQPSDWVFVGIPVLLDIEAKGINISNANFPTKIRNITTAKRFTHYTIQGTKDYMRDFGYDYEYYWYTLPESFRYKITPWTSGSPSPIQDVGPYYSPTGDFDLTGALEIRTKTAIPDTLGNIEASTPIAFSDIDFKTDIGTRTNQIYKYVTYSATYNTSQRLFHINIKPTDRALVYGIVEYKSTAIINPTTGTYLIRDIVLPMGKNFTIDMKPILEMNMPNHVTLSIIVIPIDPNIEEYEYFEEYILTGNKVG